MAKGTCSSRMATNSSDNFRMDLLQVEDNILLINSALARDTGRTVNLLNHLLAKMKCLGIRVK